MKAASSPELHPPLNPRRHSQQPPSQRRRHAAAMQKGRSQAPPAGLAVAAAAVAAAPCGVAASCRAACPPPSPPPPHLPTRCSPPPAAASARLAACPAHRRLAAGCWRAQGWGCAWQTLGEWPHAHHPRSAQSLGRPPLVIPSLVRRPPAGSSGDAENSCSVRRWHGVLTPPLQAPPRRDTPRRQYLSTTHTHCRPQNRLRHALSRPLALIQAPYLRKRRHQRALLLLLAPLLLGRLGQTQLQAAPLGRGLLHAASLPLGQVVFLKIW